MDQAQLSWITNFIWGIADDTLRDVFVRGKYLDGFSPNVQDILKNFEFRNQIPRLSESDGLGQLIEKFLDKDMNLSPRPVGELPGLDNHSIGTVFEDLVRMFNEEINAETYAICKADFLLKGDGDAADTRHFYQPPQLRTLAQISADILALEQETEGLLHEITKGATV